MLLKLRQKTTKCMRSASIIALFVPYIYGKLSFYISNIYKCVILKIIYDRHPPPPIIKKGRKRTVNTKVFCPRNYTSVHLKISFCELMSINLYLKFTATSLIEFNN